jgi:hypothetical protein
LILKNRWIDAGAIQIVEKGVSEAEAPKTSLNRNSKFTRHPARNNNAGLKSTKTTPFKQG